MKDQQIHREKSLAEMEDLLKENARWISHLENSLRFSQSQIWAFQEETILLKQGHTKGNWSFKEQNERLKKEIKRHQEIIERKNASLEEGRDWIQNLKNQNEALQQRINEIEQSFSFRLANFLTKPFGFFIPRSRKK